MCGEVLVERRFVKLKWLKITLRDLTDHGSITRRSAYLILMKIYLAGKVPKGDKVAAGFDDWRARYSQIIKTIFTDAEFIDPYNRDVDENDFLYIVGNDSKHIKDAEFTIVNAENKLGAGTAMELVIAKYLKKPIITVLPKNSHHRRSNVVFHGKNITDWIHPFIHTFSDFIIEDIRELENIKDQILQAKNIKDISIIDQAIKYRDAK